MKIGALIVTTGLSRISGVAALLSEVGAITAGQRMISAFQCAGVSLVGLVVGPDMRHRQQLIQNHNRQLSRPITEVTLYNGGPLYDPRLSMLLHLVEDTHSVRDACSLMQMSYSAAWNMLNRVEDELGFPLITRNRGGASGSGSGLTLKGKLLMDAYDQFAEHLNREAQALYGKFFNSLVEVT